MARTASPPFLDTSYVVRYLTNTPEQLATKAAALIDSDTTLVLSESILLESAYVLHSVYEIPRPDIVDALSLLVQRKNLRMAKLGKARVLEALQLCRNSKRVSFADAFLWAEALDAGALRVYTFDKRFPAQGLETVG